MKIRGRGYVPELMQLRGMAALLVFFYHSVHSGLVAQGIKNWPFAHFAPMAVLYEGHSAVALFLVLSGYLLMTKAMTERLPYRQYLLRRTLRIWPMLAVVLVLAIFSTANFDLGRFLTDNLLRIGTGAGPVQDPSQIAGTAWTAIVEFGFYLIAPFLFAQVEKHGILKYAIPLVFAFWLLRMVVLLAIHDQGELLYRVSYYSIIGRINQFMVGICLAYVVQSGTLSRFSRRSGWLGLLVSSAALIMLLAALNHEGGIYEWHRWHIVYPEIEAVLWAAFLWSFQTARPFSSTPVASVGRVLEWFGDISFSLYLLHFAIQREFWMIVYPAGLSSYIGGWGHGLFAALIWSIILLAPVCGLSALTHRCIEKPFQAMGRSKARSAPEKLREAA